MDNQQRLTAFDLENLITRCIGEAKKAGLIAERPQATSKEPVVRVIVNQEELVKHISKTIIGELYEFEICRKMGPMFRQFRSLERDFLYLDDRQAAETANLGLRIGPNDR